MATCERDLQASSASSSMRSQKSKPTLPFLSFPLELRLHIYRHVFAAARNLTLRSLFIRERFTNRFMTQQPRHDLSPALLLVCHQINREGSPYLYVGPRWICGCRTEALSTQIGHMNFAHIRHMQIDVDDLDMLVEGLQRRRQRRVHQRSGFAMQMIDVPVPTALRVDDDDDDREGDNGKALFIDGHRQRGQLHDSTHSLNFSNLEILEIEGFQSAALSRSQGTHRVRVEALRLCELASQLLDFHPLLKWLLQSDARNDNGGADARDTSLGRVRWRFVKDIDTARTAAYDEGYWTKYEGIEEVVDLGSVKSALEAMLREDERMAALESLSISTSSSSSSLPVAWTSSGTGRFHLYPFLQTM